MPPLPPAVPFYPEAQLTQDDVALAVLRASSRELYPLQAEAVVAQIAGLDTFLIVMTCFGKTAIVYSASSR